MNDTIEIRYMEAFEYRRTKIHIDGEAPDMRLVSSG